MEKIHNNSALNSLLFFNNFARNPVTGKRQVVLMSEEQEIAMGKEADPQKWRNMVFIRMMLAKHYKQKGRIGCISHRPNLIMN